MTTAAASSPRAATRFNTGTGHRGSTFKKPPGTLRIPPAEEPTWSSFSEVVTSRVRAVLTRNGGIATGMTEFEAWGPSRAIPDPIPGDNLALNSDAWMYPRIYPSFAFIHHSAFMAHDGNLSTYWNTQKSRNGTNEFLRVDLGEEKTFNNIVLSFRRAPTSMNVEYRDSGTWTAIPNVRMAPDTPVSHTTTNVVFPAIAAEQIRVNFTTSGIVEVEEIEIYSNRIGVWAAPSDLRVNEGEDATYDVLLTSQPTADVHCHHQRPDGQPECDGVPGVADLHCFELVQGADGDDELRSTTTTLYTTRRR